MSLHMAGFPDPSHYIEGARVCPSDPYHHNKPLKTLLPYHVHWRLKTEKYGSYGSRSVAAQFKSIRRTPTEAFANFYHLVKELLMFKVDGMTVKRLSPPMKEDEPNRCPQYHTYQVIETGEIFHTKSSNILQSYADHRHVRLEEDMEWE